MDVPDTFLAMVKVFNYLRWERAGIAMFVFFIGFWTWVSLLYFHAIFITRVLYRYFRHYLNLVMLYSVYKDFDLIPCVPLFHICVHVFLTAAV